MYENYVEKELEKAGRTAVSSQASESPLIMALLDKREANPVSEEELSHMKKAYAWLLHIPEDRFVLRRIVVMRSLVDPITFQCLYPYKSIAELLEVDAKAVVRWYMQGLRFISEGLKKNGNS